MRQEAQRKRKDPQETVTSSQSQSEAEEAGTTKKVNGRESFSEEFKSDLTNKDTTMGT